LAESRVTSARTLESPAILANAFALRELVELFEAFAWMAGIELPDRFAAGFDELSATFFVVANIDGVLRGARDAGFDEMFEFAVVASDEFNELACGRGRRNDIALCHQ
jgi:hypothetical protein